MEINNIGLTLNVPVLDEIKALLVERTNQMALSFEDLKSAIADLREAFETERVEIADLISDLNLEIQNLKAANPTMEANLAESIQSIQALASEISVIVDNEPDLPELPTEEEPVEEAPVVEPTPEEPAPEVVEGQ